MYNYVTNVTYSNPANSILFRILANDFEKKWDLHKGIYALHASREHGLVFKGSRTEATISRQVYLC
jgi:hypothetical protein